MCIESVIECIATENPITVSTYGLYSIFDLSKFGCGADREIRQNQASIEKLNELMGNLPFHLDTVRELVMPYEPTNMLVDCFPNGYTRIPKTYIVYMYMPCGLHTSNVLNNENSVFMLSNIGLEIGWKK